MEKERRKVNFIVLIAVAAAVLIGLVYYLVGDGSDTMQERGTLIVHIASEPERIEEYVDVFR